MIQGRMTKVLLIGLCLTATSAFAKKIESVPGEYVVKLKSRFSTMANQQLGSALGAQVVERLSKESNSVLVRRSVIEKSNFAVAALESNSLVQYAEPNYIYRAIGGVDTPPNDPSLEQLWGLINVGQKSTGDMGEVQGTAGIDIDASRAWQIETGTDKVLVAGIDTGIDYTLADLSPNMWKNKAEAEGTAGVDDDGNGIVDDIYGYNAIDDSGNMKDDHGHGSHTAGTIGAKGNDGEGIIGVAWNVRLMGVKFLSADGGGTLADAIKAIDYTTKMKVHMTSNSWGGGSFSQALYDAIKRAQDAGILFIAAAGNSSSDNDRDPEYPASYDLDNIISVAAIDAAGELAYFSCYGKTTVDVAAPGVNIYSTTPMGYDSWSGTSMATPHVTGVAALLKAAYPDMTGADIKKRIISSARPLGSLRGLVASNGMVNAYHALMNTVPGPDENDPYNWDKTGEVISSPHPYTDKYKNTYNVRVPGAKKIALHFSKFETEIGYDKVTIKNGDGKVVAVMSGNHTDRFSPVIDGESAVIEFVTDDSATYYGFDIDGIAYK